MTSDLIALMCVYDEAALIGPAIASLAGAADRVIVADGRYHLYPGESWDSQDGTLDAAAAAADEAGLGLEIIPAPAGGWPTEHAKRTALVQDPSIELGAELLVLDADERLEATNPGRLRDFYGDYKIAVIGEPPTAGRLDSVRLFAWRPGIEYRWHWGLFTPGGRAVHNAVDQLHPGDVAIRHVHHHRSPARCASDKTYEERLVPAERDLGAYGSR